MPTGHPAPAYLLPAEFVGMATITDDVLDVGGVKVGPILWGDIGVYVRRVSSDLRIVEIHMAAHEGLAQETLDEQNVEAEQSPLGAKEYWRGQMVGKYPMGTNGHVMTDEEFDADYWDEGET